MKGFTDTRRFAFAKGKKLMEKEPVAVRAGVAHFGGLLGEPRGEIGVANARGENVSAGTKGRTEALGDDSFGRACGSTLADARIQKAGNQRIEGEIRRVGIRCLEARNPLGKATVRDTAILSSPNS